MSELALMARTILIEDGARPITEGDRGIISRSTDSAQLAELLRQLLAKYKEQRTPAEGLTLILLLVLCAVTAALWLIQLLAPAFAMTVVTAIAYVAHKRAARVSTRLFRGFEGWFRALTARLEELERTEGEPRHEPPSHEAPVTLEPFELTGLAAPVFIGKGVRAMTEADRLTVRACQDGDALIALQSSLRAKARQPGAEEWLRWVDARVAQLVAREE